MNQRDYLSRFEGRLAELDLRLRDMQGTISELQRVVELMHANEEANWPRLSRAIRHVEQEMEKQSYGDM